MKRQEKEYIEQISKQLIIIEELENDCKVHEAAFAILKFDMSLEEAIKELDRLTKNNENLSSKLDELIKNFGNKNLIQVKKRDEENLSMYKSEYTKRKILVTDILDVILENYQDTKENLYKDIGINVV